jgi:hypothetical protein
MLGGRVNLAMEFPSRELPFTHIFLVFKYSILSFERRNIYHAAIASSTQR